MYATSILVAASSGCAPPPCCDVRQGAVTVSIDPFFGPQGSVSLEEAVGWWEVQLGAKRLLIASEGPSTARIEYGPNPPDTFTLAETFYGQCPTLIYVYYDPIPAEQYIFTKILIHELGHAMDIQEHSPDRNSIMYSRTTLSHDYMIEQETINQLRSICQ